MTNAQPRMRIVTAGLPDAAKSLPLSAFGPEMFNSEYGGNHANDVIYHYEHTPWLYRGVNVIADALTRLFWDFTKPDGEELEKPKFPFEWNTKSVMDFVGGDLTLYGRTYWLIGASNGGRVKEVRRFHPTTIKPCYDPLLGLTHYERTVCASTVEFAPEEIIAINLPPRKSELGYDVAPAMAALQAAGMLLAIDNMGRTFFEKGAINPTIVALKDQSSPLSDNQLEKFQSWLDRAVSGVKNAFSVRAVQAPFEKLQLGDAPDKLEMAGLTDKKREDIATALGVPQSILFSNASNYATAQQDAMHLYDLTVTPMAELASDAFNAGLFQHFGLELTPHPERLEVFQALELNKAQGLSLARDRNVISINEFRESIGFRKLDDPRYDALENVSDAEVDAALEDFEGGDDEMDEELRKWRKAVSKRMKAGKRMNRSFDAPHVPLALRASIEGALEDADSVDHAHDIFADARAWAGYP